MWWDREVTFGTGSALAVLWWVAAVGLLATGWVLGRWELGMAGLMCSAMGVSLLIIRDNAKTRSVVRAVAMAKDPQPPVRSLRSE